MRLRHFSRCWQVNRMTPWFFANLPEWPAPPGYPVSSKRTSASSRIRGTPSAPPPRPDGGRVGTADRWRRRCATGRRGGFSSLGSGLREKSSPGGKTLVAPARHGGKIGLRPLGNPGRTAAVIPTAPASVSWRWSGGVGLFQLGKTGVDRGQLRFQPRPVA